MQRPVAIVERVIQAPPEQVFAVLKDGWTYSDWVVGTAHIRAVDPHWPQPGSRLYHKVGPWPLSVRDHSEVLACAEGFINTFHLRHPALTAAMAIDPRPR